MHKFNNSTNVFVYFPLHLIDLCFTPYRQYFSHLSAKITKKWKVTKFEVSFTALTSLLFFKIHRNGVWMPRGLFQIWYSAILNISYSGLFKFCNFFTMFVCIFGKQWSNIMGLYSYIRKYKHYFRKNYSTIPETMELWLTMEKTIVLWRKVYYSIFLKWISQLFIKFYRKYKINML